MPGRLTPFRDPRLPLLFTVHTTLSPTISCLCVWGLALIPQPTNIYPEQELLKVVEGIVMEVGSLGFGVWGLGFGV